MNSTNSPYTINQRSQEVSGDNDNSTLMSYPNIQQQQQESHNIPQHSLYSNIDKEKERQQQQPNNDVIDSQSNIIHLDTFRQQFMYKLMGGVDKHYKLDDDVISTTIRIKNNSAKLASFLVAFVVTSLILFVGLAVSTLPFTIASWSFHAPLFSECLIYATFVIITSIHDIYIIFSNNFENITTRCVLLILFTSLMRFFYYIVGVCILYVIFVIISNIVITIGWKRPFSTYDIIAMTFTDGNMEFSIDTIDTIMKYIDEDLTKVLRFAIFITSYISMALLSYESIILYQILEWKERSNDNCGSLSLENRDRICTCNNSIPHIHKKLYNNNTDRQSQDYYKANGPTATGYPDAHPSLCNNARVIRASRIN